MAFVETSVSDQQPGVTSRGVSKTWRTVRRDVSGQERKFYPILASFGWVMLGVLVEPWAPTC